MYTGLHLLLLVLIAALTSVVLLRSLYYTTLRLNRCKRSRTKRSLMNMARNMCSTNTGQFDREHGENNSFHQFVNYSSSPSSTVRFTDEEQEEEEEERRHTVSAAWQVEKAEKPPTMVDTNMTTTTNTTTITQLVPSLKDAGGEASDGKVIYSSSEWNAPSAPPLSLSGVALPAFMDHHYHELDRECRQSDTGPPPPYNEVITSCKGPKHDEHRYKVSQDHSSLAPGIYAAVISGCNDLEWHQVFNAFNEKRMAIATHWAPPPKSEQALKRRLVDIDEFLLARTHPVGERVVYRFLQSFAVLTNLVYAQSAGLRRINVADAVSPAVDFDKQNTTWRSTYREIFLNAFRLLVKEYVPKEPITDGTVVPPFGYDWFIFTGHLTYALINAHITLCTMDAVDSATSSITRPYYTENTWVDTWTVARGLKNICTNFTKSLGHVRYGSDRVYVGTAFLYGSLLEIACDRLSEYRATTSFFSPGGGVLPDYIEVLNEILFNPTNHYDTFDGLIRDIGKTHHHVPTPVDVAVVSTTPITTISTCENQTAATCRGGDGGDGVTGGSESTDIMAYDGVYDDGTFFARRRLRMYSYIRPYCEQLFSVQLLLRERLLDDARLSALLNAVKPMSGDGALFYFNLHSCDGAFEYRTGSALFSILGISKFSMCNGGDTTNASNCGRVYVADRARILFVQSHAFTFHTVGQLSDLAFGDENQKADRDLMPAQLMGQRPLFRSENSTLLDVPCAAHLEPCVIDTRKSKTDPNETPRHTTDDYYYYYTPTEAYSAVVAFEEQKIGAVFTSVRETSMDVHYSRCTVATPHYTFTTYFRITRAGSCGVEDDNNERIRLSCYTGGGVERNVCAAAASTGRRHKRHGGDLLESGEIVLNNDNTRVFDFKHCTVQVFLQTRDGTDYEGDAVTVCQREGVEKRRKSKSTYASSELKNVSVSLIPYIGGGGGCGGGGGTDPNSKSLGSVTILNRPKPGNGGGGGCGDDDGGGGGINPEYYVSLAKRSEITPSVTVQEEENIYRIRVDARYVLYCDGVRNVLVLLDVLEKRACVANVSSSVRDDAVSPPDRVGLMERASATVRGEVLGNMKYYYDTFCRNRIYTYFE